MFSKVDFAILTLCSTVIFVKTLFNGNTMDDHPAIEWNVVVVGRKQPFWSSLFSTDFWGQDLTAAASHGSFRPVVTAMYRLQAIVTHYLKSADPGEYTPPNPSLLHFVNIVFHWLTTVLFYIFCLIFSGSQEITKFFSARLTVPLVASTLFALHPIHCEAVCGGVGQAEVVCSSLMFLALILHQKLIQLKYSLVKQVTLSVVIFLLALLAAGSKEQGFMLFPLCFLIELIYVGEKSSFSWARLVFFTISMVLLAVGRLHLFGAPRTGLFLFFDNPASFEPSPVRQFTYAFLPIFGIYKMFNPNWLSADWSDGAIALVKSVWDPRLIASSLIYLAVTRQIFKIFKSSFQMSKIGDREFLMAFFIYISTFLPSSNLLGNVGFVVAERVLYLPSAGFCLLVAIGLQRLFRYFESRDFPKEKVIFIMILTFSFHGIRTAVRTHDWKSDINLSYSGLRSTQSNARIFINVGAYIRETTGDLPKALAYFDVAVRLNPLMAKAHFNRARCLRSMIENRKQEAADIKAGKSVKPPSLRDAPLGAVAKACDASLRHCIAVAKYSLPSNGFVPNHIVECFLDLVNLMTVHGELYLGPVAQSQQVADQAIQLCDMAEQMRPDFARVYITRANLMMAMQKFDEAKKQLLKANELDVRNPEIPRAIGWIFAERELNDSEALKYYHEAMEKRPGYELAIVEFAKIVIRSNHKEYYPLASYRLSEAVNQRSQHPEIPKLLHNLNILMSKR